MSSAPDSPLKFLAPAWFAPVMGWCGLSLAWQRAADALGATAENAASLAALVAGAIFILVLAASLLRLRRHPGALSEDLAHPVRHAFVAAFPVSLLLLGTVALNRGAPTWAALMLWLPGLLLQLVVIVWVLGRWLSGRQAWAAMTPALYIPAVANILVPLAGVPFGLSAIAWGYFGIGMFLWPVITTLIMARQSHQPMPARLSVMWFIAVAPPSVGGLSAMALGAPVWVGLMALGVALLMLLAVLSQLPLMLRQPFAVSAWASSFPMAAFTALVMACASAAPGLAGTGLALLAASSVLIVGLSLATLRGLWRGELLLPDPAPPPVT